MLESHMNDYYKPCEVNIEKVVRELDNDNELKFETRNNKNFRIFLIVLLILTSVALIIGITALCFAIIQQHLIIEFKSI
jgi:hypothetical protein